MEEKWWLSFFPLGSNPQSVDHGLHTWLILYAAFGEKNEVHVITHTSSVADAILRSAKELKEDIADIRVCGTAA